MFAEELWKAISRPGDTTLKEFGFVPPAFTVLSKLEQFCVIRIEAPILISIFAASPVVFYQLWRLIAPRIRKQERHRAIPFALWNSGAFIAGGVFAYFVVLPANLKLQLKIDCSPGCCITMVTISEYFDLFVNATLGLGMAFDLPALMSFLTLARITNPRSLFSHSREAMLVITLVAAVITPTPDVFNQVMFAVPMMLMYFVGAFVSYLVDRGRVVRWRGLPKHLVWSLIAYASVFALTVYFANELWRIISRPASEAFRDSVARSGGGNLTPLGQFSIIWVKVPLVFSTFLTCPLVFYQLWRCICT
jgi:sec-independent protein translocase protein TatC